MLISFEIEKCTEEKKGELLNVKKPYYTYILVIRIFFVMYDRFDKSTMYIKTNKASTLIT